MILRRPAVLVSTPASRGCAQSQPHSVQNYLACKWLFAQEPARGREREREREKFIDNQIDD